MTDAPLVRSIVALPAGHRTAVIGAGGAFYLLNVATPPRLRPWPLLAAIIVATGFTAIAILEPILGH